MIRVPRRADLKFLVVMREGSKKPLSMNLLDPDVGSSFPQPVNGNKVAQRVPMGKREGILDE